MDHYSIVIIALALQFAAVICVYIKIKKPQYRYLGFMFLCVLVIFHGVTEIFQLVFPDSDGYRKLTDEKYLDHWLIWVTLAIIIYAAVYCIMLQWKKPHKLWNRPIVMARVYNWRLCLPLGLFFTIVKIIDINQISESYWLGSMVEIFASFPLLIGTADLILKMPLLWEAPILIALAVVMSLTDSRFIVVASVVSLLCLLARMGRPVSAMKLITVFGFCLALGMIISQSRSLYGRDALQSNIQETIMNLSSGATSFTSTSDSKQEMWNDIAYRFDGNSVSSIFMERIETGQIPAGGMPIYTGVFLCVPSFIMPSKLQTDVTMRSDKSYLTEYYQLPDNKDWLIGLFGAFYGCYGLASLLCGSVFMALLYGWLDNNLVLEGSIWHTLLFLCFIQTALSYEQNIKGYFLLLRSTILMYATFWAIEKAFLFLGGGQSPAHEDIVKVNAKTSISI